ncbi:hypothetical protein SAMD00019534_036520 [Acytostelium subglobosum LB1]|uniref:hypothetical protein n=1 Tax=Acytostelium subglobosum LB1 TaxID=1410327 RepID=UPI0006450B7D|nr:hypothetical protein SAMD00019534_036520 [Acytostelium subglobosum LB1]GAM20477.1 hypothetical protein SAMD00019534_036520 [Acytostelium subglobosum LB1]|eukprot:XP_012759998.1 hypothetical protein SAMD00019534_036520 [Acytostelium subglobosum LB1]
MSLQLLLVLLLHLLCCAQSGNAQTLQPLTVYITPQPASGVRNITCGLDSDHPCWSLADLFASLGNQDYKASQLNMTIYMAPGTYPSKGNINAQLFGLTVTMAAQNESAPTTIDAGFEGGPILVVQEPTTSVPANASTTISVRGVTFQGGNNKNGDGGAISAMITNSSMSITLTNCTFNNNTAGDNDGGAINVVFNTSSYDPAVLARAVLSVDRCLFTANEAKNGGAINTEYTTLLLKHSEFVENSARNGGAINSASAPIHAMHVLFDSNGVNADGGAILFFNQHVSSSTFDYCNFVDNEAGVGGAIYLGQSGLHMRNTNFTNNAARGVGGAVAAKTSPSYLNVSECHLVGNAGSNGGALYFDEANFDITSTSFVQNTAIQGGALYFGYAEGDITNVHIDGNNASLNGGAIFTTFGRFTMNNVTIDNNRAQLGGTMYCSASSVTIPQPVIIDNNTDTSHTGNNGDSTDNSGSANEYENRFNIYCSLIPEYTFCTFFGAKDYIELCGEVPIPQAHSMAKWKLVLIIVGGVLGLGVVAFGIGCLLARSTDKGDKNYDPILTGINTGEDDSSIQDAIDAMDGDIQSSLAIEEDFKDREL